MSEPAALPNPTNLPFVEELYESYLSDPDSVPTAWRAYFAALAPPGDGAPAPHFRPSFKPTTLFNPARRNGVGDETRVDTRQDRVDQLVRAYRVRGHLIAQLDPLHRPHRTAAPALKVGHYGFTKDDLNRSFSSRTIAGAPVRPLKEIIRLLRNTYCRSIGVQFMHIDDLHVRHWLQDRMEGTQNRLTLSRSEQLRILTRLTDAVIFEEFIQRKYVGAKRFSLEGAESLIPLLDLAIERAGEHGVDEIVIGMPHRGRINVLANILEKSPRQIFREFADVDAELRLGGGDVKYHLGFHNTWKTSSGHDVHLALCFNPSHLEFVNPVAMGRMRAKQDRLGDVERRKGMALLIHGDAAFIGEGVVQESLTLSELAGYRTGGALHVVVNNQIGFTTPPEQARSSTYSTCVAKMLQSPIFHVNGEDPEAVAQVVRLAMDFRHEFQRDVVIDMYCYRRYGHNEGDEPAFTQPAMYRVIKARKSVREGYLDHLLAHGDVTREQADEIERALRTKLEEELAGMEREGPSVPFRPSVLSRVWSQYAGGLDSAVPEIDTGVPRERLADLLTALSTTPTDFRAHPKIQRLLAARRQMAAGERDLDWATAEALALASLAAEGTPIRLSGQDSQRGTFSQRHAVLHDQQTGATYTPLEHVADGQAPVRLFNSPLSEAAVLGFEYGYSIAYPDALVMWEAQFGDFVNAAQVIVDQFIASAEDKWRSLCGLVLLLPHGFEGQGPEHSSARPERFLSLAAQDNLQVVYPTTPAQYYHVLRRQVRRPWRKPLVVLTPKSLLRDPRAVSPLDDLTHGRFQRVLPDAQVAADRAKRVLLCAGKVYYDLASERERLGRDDVAIVRVEQLYPLSDALVEQTLAPFGSNARVTWVQEEPENMGAWPYWRMRFGDRILGRWLLNKVARPASASPATGSLGGHRLEQQQLLAAAFVE